MLIATSKQTEFINLKQTRMSTNLFINYNGHSVTVTCLPDDVYYVQLSHVPYKIKCVESENGECLWLEMADEIETPLSKLVGEMIKKQEEAVAAGG